MSLITNTSYSGHLLALVNILKFFIASEEQLLPQVNMFGVADEVVRIFNLFITYGDTFLPNPTTYDELYYELIRVSKVFEDLHSLGKIAVGLECAHSVPLHREQLCVM